MNITKKALENHDEIFNGVKYAPAGENRPMDETNPEYVETFLNFAFDIEACAINNKSEMLTYSIALMSCDNDSDVCYWYNNVSNFNDMLFNLRCKEINLFLQHNNLYY